MHPHTHTYTDTHKYHNIFKLTLFQMHGHTQPHTHAHTHTHTHTHKHTRKQDQRKSAEVQNFSAITVDVKQQNLNMANENIGSCVILYCTSY